MSDNDVLYDCAVAYKKLMDYEFKFILDNDYTEMALQFNESNFMHLTSIEKLTDLWELKHISSENVLNLILNHDLTYDRLTESEKFDEQTHAGKSPDIEYTIKDRLLALTHLYDYLHDISLDNTTIYKWLKDVQPDNRPNHSKINADFLIEFSETHRKKTEAEKGYAFFIDGNNNSISTGVSIFPTDTPYSNDGNIALNQYITLSVVEINKTTGLSTELIHTDREIIEKARSNSIQKNTQKQNHKTINNDLKVLKSKRAAYHKSPTPKTERAYKGRMQIFQNTNIYNIDMLEDAVSRLQTQMNDPHNQDVVSLIAEEIKNIQAQISERKRG